MYAVVRTGGKQMKVSPGDAVRVGKLDGGVGDRVEMTEGLLVAGDGDPRVRPPPVAAPEGGGTPTGQGPGLRHHGAARGQRRIRLAGGRVLQRVAVDDPERNGLEYPEVKEAVPRGNQLPDGGPERVELQLGPVLARHGEGGGEDDADHPRGRAEGGRHGFFFLPGDLDATASRARWPPGSGQRPERPGRRVHEPVAPVPSESFFANWSDRGRGVPGGVGQEVYGS